MSISQHDMWMVAVLGIVILAILWSLERRSKSKKSKINLDDLLLGDDGKASKAAFVMHGAFVLTSWVVLYQTLNKTLTDTVFGLYVASWVAPAVTKLIKGPAPPSPNATSETIISQTTVTPTKEITP